MDKLPVLEIPAGIDEHATNRTVFAAHARPAIAHILPPTQTGKNILAYRSINVELSNRMADVFIACVSQQI